MLSSVCANQSPRGYKLMFNVREMKATVEFGGGLEVTLIPWSLAKVPLSGPNIWKLLLVCLFVCWYDPISSWTKASIDTNRSSHLCSTLSPCAEAAFPATPGSGGGSEKVTLKAAADTLYPVFVWHLAPLCKVKRREKEAFPVGLFWWNCFEDRKKRNWATLCWCGGQFLQDAVCFALTSWEEEWRDWKVTVPP